MASLRKRKGKWYSRVSWRNELRQKKERQIPLRTDNKTVAHKRNREVSRYEKDIRQGLDFEFGWLKDGGTTEVKELTLGEAVDKWMSRRMKQPDIRSATIEINKNSITHLYESIAKSTPLKSITTKHMDSFSDNLVDKGLSSATVNIHLRGVKTFFRYCWHREMINKLPMIKMIKMEETDPIYITDDEFHAVLNEVGVDSFYGKVFFFYRETGVRLREPFIATLDGNWLDIPNTSKGKRPRSIELTDFLVEIYQELKQWADESHLVQGNRGRHLSKKFKKALRKCGVDESKHLHSLRHTFAVRHRVIGTPMAMIQAIMGHKSIDTTEQYAVIDLKKLRRHFPTLLPQYTDARIEDEKVSKTSKVDTNQVDTGSNYIALTDGKLMN
jgi:integrase